MGSEVQKSTGNFGSEKDLRNYERKLYVFLQYVVGLHKGILKAYGIDHKIFNYYFNTAPVWSRRKEEFMEKLLEIIETEYPSLHEVKRELENYIQAIRKFRRK